MARFSIILPVRNGGAYIKECVAGILSQTHRDFDLLVLDNNSTDGTGEWLKSITDPRVRLFPSAIPLTIEQNWGRILDVPKNEFITLIGHDDILQKNYLEVISGLIDKHPDASLYQTHFSYIDGKGNKIRDCKKMAERETAAEFLENFLLNQTDVMGTGFMLRATAYDQLGGIPAYPNLLFADFELWISATGLSYKVTAPENCFSFRIHQSTTTTSPDTRYHKAFNRFISFLRDLGSRSDNFARPLRKHFSSFLLFYCQGLSHRLLRTPVSQREGLTVRKFVRNCIGYSQGMGVGESFHPYRKFSITLAAIIDSNIFTRSLFLFFKWMFPRPFLK